MSTTALVNYDAARVALAKATRVDDAKEIHDKAEALRVYARQQGDLELEKWVARIKVRAMIRIGELSAELEKGKTGPKGQLGSSPGPKSKKDALKAANISKSKAKRAEQLAKPAARKAVDEYIETATKPITITQALNAANPKPRAAGSEEHETAQQALAWLKDVTRATREWAPVIRDGRVMFSPEGWQKAANMIEKLAEQFGELVKVMQSHQSREQETVDDHRKG